MIAEQLQLIPSKIQAEKLSVSQVLSLKIIYVISQKPNVTLKELRAALDIVRGDADPLLRAQQLGSEYVDAINELQSVNAIFNLQSNMAHVISVDTNDRVIKPWSVCGLYLRRAIVAFHLSYFEDIVEIVQKIRKICFDLFSNANSASYLTLPNFRTGRQLAFLASQESKRLESQIDSSQELCSYQSFKNCSSASSSNADLILPDLLRHLKFRDERKTMQLLYDYFDCSTLRRELYSALGLTILLLKMHHYAEARLALSEAFARRSLPCEPSLCALFELEHSGAALASIARSGAFNDEMLKNFLLRPRKDNIDTYGVPLKFSYDDSPFHLFIQLVHLSFWNINWHFPLVVLFAQACLRHEIAKNILPTELLNSGYGVVDTNNNNELVAFDRALNSCDWDKAHDALHSLPSCQTMLYSALYNYSKRNYESTIDHLRNTPKPESYDEAARGILMKACVALGVKDFCYAHELLSCDGVKYIETAAQYASLLRAKMFLDEHNYSLACDILTEMVLLVNSVGETKLKGIFFYFYSLALLSQTECDMSSVRWYLAKAATYLKAINETPFLMKTYYLSAIVCDRLNDIDARNDFSRLFRTTYASVHRRFYGF